MYLVLIFFLEKFWRRLLWWKIICENEQLEWESETRKRRRHTELFNSFPAKNSVRACVRVCVCCLSLKFNRVFFSKLCYRLNFVKRHFHVNFREAISRLGSFKARILRNIFQVFSDVTPCRNIPVHTVLTTKEDLNFVCVCSYCSKTVFSFFLQIEFRHKVYRKYKTEYITVYISTWKLSVYLWRGNPDSF